MSFFSKMNFKSRLLGITACSIVVSALIASISTAWVTTDRAASRMISQGLKNADDLAHQGVLALLYESRENAEGPLRTALSFPDVRQAGLFDINRTPLLVSEGPPLALTAEETPSEPRLIRDTGDAWHFVAPAVAGAALGIDDATAQFQLGELRQERLGYAYVVVNKASLREMRIDVFFSNILIALCCALALILVLNVVIKRLTQPLYRLAELMTQAEQKKTHVYADLRGPEEITHMAGVFNQMMASLEEQEHQLRRHGKTLQSQVDMRTRELVLARDAAMTASRHKSEFLANMSHELRTPLQSIIGYVDVVMEELDLEGMDEQVEELGRVMTNADRLLALINNILDLAKIEAGRMDLTLQPINLKTLVKETVDAILPLLKKNRNAIDVDVRECGMELIADREKLLQMMLNLLSNAGKFTHEGRIDLDVVHEEHSLLIRVADTGIGIAPEAQKIIFDEFRQVDGSTTRKFEGTGLGLAITRRFCELMGGTITVDSALGTGSTFVLTLPLPITTSGQRPLADAASEESAAEPEEASMTTPDLYRKQYRVLLVDDDLEFLDLQHRALERAGYQVFSARSGAEALARAKAMKPDVITLDIMMPNMDGWMVLKKLNEDPELREIPVIVASILDERRQGYLLGAKDYLIKPIQRAKFLMAIDNVCCRGGRQG